MAKQSHRRHSANPARERMSSLAVRADESGDDDGPDLERVLQRVVFHALGTALQDVRDRRILSEHNAPASVSMRLISELEDGTPAALHLISEEDESDREENILTFENIVQRNLETLRHELIGTSEWHITSWSSKEGIHRPSVGRIKLESAREQNRESQSYTRILFGTLFELLYEDFRKSNEKGLEALRLLFPSQICLSHIQILVDAICRLLHIEGFQMYFRSVFGFGQSSKANATLDDFIVDLALQIFYGGKPSSKLDAEIVLEHSLLTEPPFLRAWKANLEMHPDNPEILRRLSQCAAPESEVKRYQTLLLDIQGTATPRDAAHAAKIAFYKNRDILQHRYPDSTIEYNTRTLGVDVYVVEALVDHLDIPDDSIRDGACVIPVVIKQRTSKFL